MTAHSNTIAAPLVYNEIPIRDRGEMLSLTDMWKAAGSDPQQAPAQWQRLPNADNFIAHVGLIVGKSHNKLIEGRKRGGTFAHWQIGLAYAKYLSPEFHMWCNDVVRERMEGKSVSTANLPPEVVELLRRTDGISRMLSRKVTEMEGTLAVIMATVKPDSGVMIRRGKTAGQIWKRYGFPPLKSAAKWFGNRLVEMGCMLNRADRGDGAIRLFDPDKVEVVMMNGLRFLVKDYVAQRQGQRRLRLIGGGAS